MIAVSDVGVFSFMPHAVFLALLVGFGGALGSVLRYGANILLGSWLGTTFPYGVLLINVTGCFLMGVLAGAGAFLWQAPEPLRVFLMVGVLGGFTTFSAFALDVLTLVERNQLSLAAGYVFASVLLSLGAVFAGLLLVKGLS